MTTETLTGQKTLIVLHQVRGQDQRVVGVEGGLQLVPVRAPDSRHTPTVRLVTTQTVVPLGAARRYLHRLQQALGPLLSSRGVSSLIFGTVVTGRGSRTCSTRLP